MDLQESHWTNKSVVPLQKQYGGCIKFRAGSLTMIDLKLFHFDQMTTSMKTFLQYPNNFKISEPSKWMTTPFIELAINLINKSIRGGSTYRSPELLSRKQGKVTPRNKWLQRPDHPWLEQTHTLLCISDYTDEIYAKLHTTFKINKGKSKDQEYKSVCWRFITRATKPAYRRHVWRPTRKFSPCAFA